MIYEHLNPHGIVSLNMAERLNIKIDHPNSQKKEILGD